MSSTPEPHRILFLFSDTGGGHRSTAQAVIDALDPQRFDCALLDVLHAYAPRPFNRLPRHYPDLVRYPKLWELGYHLSDGPRRTQSFYRMIWPLLRPAVQRLLAEQNADMYVSVHPLLNTPILQALGPRRVPFITIVSDLVSTHAFWYDRQVDLCLVPTDSAKRRALQAGIPPRQVRVIGLPVASAYCQTAWDRSSLREELAWPQDRPIVLIVGGGEGMGPLFETAKAIDQPNLRLALAVVAGRNQSLLQRLQRHRWSSQVFVYGYERRLAKMMRAADMLVTKAGPSTIAEALNARLPMVLYSKLPGQEDGNVHFVVESGAGVWAPGPARSAAAVRALLEQPRALARASEACARQARPEAARRGAAIISDCMDRYRIQNTMPVRKMKKGRPQTERALKIGDDIAEEVPYASSEQGQQHDHR
jgi:1,2-diacylglycerol 3-beta-galactosyltransferase